MNYSLYLFLDPHGSTVESHLFSQVDGSYKVEWTPRIAGKPLLTMQFISNNLMWPRYPSGLETETLTF